MATGDQNDFQYRIIGDLPRWFGDLAVAPVINGVLAAAAYVAAQVYALIAYVRPLTRIATATDGWLDLASLDYFGGGLPRQSNESDAAFRSRILANLLPERATRRGMIKALTVLTGTAPTIVEPWRPADVMCAGYGYVGQAPVGSSHLPAQALITVTLPPGNGGAGIAGVGTDYAGVGAAYFAAVGASTLGSRISNQDVYDTINAFKAEGTTMWVNIEN